MLRAQLSICLVLAGNLTQAAELAPSVPAVKETLHTVVRQQLEAFRRNDFVSAHRFAAKGIREQFPVEAFEEMVRKGYPIIVASTDVVFGLTMDDGERAIVSLRVIGKGKQSVRFQYLLERDGSDWRIAGVYEQSEKSEAI
jgi:hypothetical protein